MTEKAENPEAKPEEPGWQDIILNEILERYEPSPSARSADMRLTTGQLLKKIWENDDPPHGSRERLFKALSEKGFKLRITGFSDDLEMKWLFNERKNK